jgi:Undecaprenyl-phosphate glucose phosphotransferase
MSRPADVELTNGAASFPTPLLPGSASVFAAAFDVAAILLAGIVAPLLYWGVTGIEIGADLSVGVPAMLALFFVLLMRSWGLYEARHLLAIERQMKWAATAWLASFGLVLGAAFLLKMSADLSRGAVLVFAVFGLVVLMVQRLTWRHAFSKALAQGVLRRRRALIISLRPWSETAPQMRLLRRAGVEIAGRHLVDGSSEDESSALSRVVSAARQNAPDEILILLSRDGFPAMSRVVAGLRSVPLPVRLMPEPALSELYLQPALRLGPCALVDVARAPLTGSEQALKRAFDVAVAVLALLAVAPILLLAIVAIRFDTPGPVLFRQTRRGFNGRTFRILKLRTMTVLEDGPAVAQATLQDARVTRVGAWLRRTSIDELPQLWNVLRGEMSVVGPRPHAVAHDDHYHRFIQNYAFRHHVRPGITGWAQVNGHRGETREVAAMAARVEHDLWYIDNWSMRTDLRIIFLTVTRLLAPNAY